MPGLDRHWNLLFSIHLQWNKAERDIKIAEQICGEVAYPAINELRYAGRRLADAIGFANADDGDVRIGPLLHDACFDCLRARHDAVDAGTTKIAIELDIFADKIGHDVILESFTEFPDLYVELRQIREKIANSRKARDRREEIYEEIENFDFPKLVSSYSRLRAAEPVMRAVAKKRRRNMVLGYWITAASLLFGIAGLVIAVLAWLYPRTPPA